MIDRLERLSLRAFEVAWTPLAWLTAGMVGLTIWITLYHAVASAIAEVVGK
jgi:hypothetical protein